MSTEFSEEAPRPPEPPLPVPRRDDDWDEPARSVRIPPEECLTATAAHLGGLLSWILAPLILYLLQPNRRSLAGWHAREAFNFQLSLVIYYLLTLPLLGLGFIDITLLLVACALLCVAAVGLMLFELVVVIWASVAAYRGVYFRCPLTIPFIPRPQLVPTDSDDYADRE